MVSINSFAILHNDLINIHYFREMLPLIHKKNVLKIVLSQKKNALNQNCRVLIFTPIRGRSSFYRLEPLHMAFISKKHTKKAANKTPVSPFWRKYYFNEPF